MWDGFIGNQIRRASKNLLIVNLVLLFFVATSAFSNWRYLYNFAKGPFPIDTSALANLPDPDSLQQYFVTVDNTNSFPTGLQEISVKNGQSTSKGTVLAEVHALPVGDRFLLVKVKRGQSGPQYAGALVRLPEEMRGKIPPKLAQHIVSGVLLDTTDFKENGYWGLAVGIPLLLLALWNVLKAAQRFGRPETHPAIEKLKKFGTPEIMIGRIDAEVAASTPSDCAGETRVTANWLLNAHSLGLNAIRLCDVVWAYRKVVQHRVNFVPAGKTNHAVVCTRDGKSLEITGKEVDVNQLLKIIATRVPWILAGYDANIAKLWTSKRNAMIAAFDERKANFLSAAAKPKTA